MRSGCLDRRVTRAFEAAVASRSLSSSCSFMRPRTPSPLPFFPLPFSFPKLVLFIHAQRRDSICDELHRKRTAQRKEISRKFNRRPFELKMIGGGGGLFSYFVLVAGREEYAEANLASHRLGKFSLIREVLKWGGRMRVRTLPATLRRSRTDAWDSYKILKSRLRTTHAARLASTKQARRSVANSGGAYATDQAHGGGAAKDASSIDRSPSARTYPRSA